MTIRVWDFECSGLTVDDADVIECGWTDITLPSRTISDPKSYLCGTSRVITPENRAVHHISAEQLAGRDPFNAETFNQSAIDDGVACLAAFNAAFDQQWLPTTLPVICVYKCALRAWPEMTKHSNSAVFYALEDMSRCRGANYAYITTHRAGPDSYVTAWIVKALLEDGHTGKTLLQWSREPAVLPGCPVGKHKGKPWSDIDAGWLRWCIGSDLGEDIRHNAQRELATR